MSKLRKYINRQEGGDEQEFLKNWYSKRKIKDKYIQEAYELDKPNIMKNLNNFKDFTYVDSIKGGNSKEMQGLVKGQFQIPNKVLIKKGLNKEDLNETKLHELNHYSTYDKSGDYMTTIHQNIVDSELLPKEYRNKEYQNDYYSDPREVHSRIMVLRKDAGFKPDKPVTMKDLDGYLKKKEVRDKKGNLLHYKLPSNVNDIFNNAKDHDSILNMLNYMAVNESTDNGVIKAQEGIGNPILDNTFVSKKYINPLDKQRINREHYKSLIDSKKSYLNPQSNTSQRVKNIGLQIEANEKINSRQDKANMLGLALAPVPVLGEIYNTGNMMAQGTVDALQGEYSNAVISAIPYGIGKINKVPGVLNKAYKLNPFAKGNVLNRFDKNSFLRQVDNETYQEGIESGLIRGKQNIPIGEKGSINLNKSFGDDAYYRKGQPYYNNQSKNPYMYEVQKGEESFIPKVNGRTKNYSTENTDIRVSKSPIPVKESNIYKHHWLRGYEKQQQGGKGSFVNAEAGEVYKDKQGNIMKVSDEAPSHDDGVLVDENENLHNASYNNGGVVIDANSVLSATHENRDSSDKSYGLVDELIKIKPKELKQYGDMLGLKVKSKKTVSPSKAFELLRDSKIKQVNKLLNVEDDVFADSFKRNSIKANLQQANSLISDEELYDTLFQIQEQKKLI